MLAIISDLHLLDGTLGKSINNHAFSLFASRLRKMAFEASWRKNGEYHPIDSLEILLLGDFLDPMQSRRWFENEAGKKTDLRPWHDTESPGFSQNALSITRAILANNKNATQVFRQFSTEDGLQLPPSNRQKKPAYDSQERICPQVRVHYMVGNHDWYFRLQGAEYDTMRMELINAFGLSNDPTPFPHTSEESEALHQILKEYRVVARHGDIYDNFSYNCATGRNSASLGDIFISNIHLNFPFRLKDALGEELSTAMENDLVQMLHIRPPLAMPIWIEERINSTVDIAVRKKIKQVWNKMLEEFIEMKSVQEQLASLGAAERAWFMLLLNVTRRASVSAMSDIANWTLKNIWDGNRSIVQFARQEKDIQNGQARYAVYGHTHHQEEAPLKDVRGIGKDFKQTYFNTGAWGLIYDFSQLSLGSPSRHDNRIHCTTIFRDDERGGQGFEPWWASFA